MQEKGIDIQSAFDYAGVVFERLMHRYLEDRTRIASLGPEVDADVKRYVDCILHWVVGSIEWSFETPRYFGEQRTEVLRTLEITSKGNDADCERLCPSPFDPFGDTAPEYLTWSFLPKLSPYRHPYVVLLSPVRCHHDLIL